MFLCSAELGPIHICIISVCKERDCWTLAWPYDLGDLMGSWTFVLPHGLKFSLYSGSALKTMGSATHSPAWPFLSVLCFYHHPFIDLEFNYHGHLQHEEIYSILWAEWRPLMLQGETNHGDFGISVLSSLLIHFHITVSYCSYLNGNCLKYRCICSFCMLVLLRISRYQL